MPSNNSYGISIDFNNRLTVAAQYDFQDWSTYEERFSDTTNPGLQAVTTYRFGIQYRPKPNLSPDSRFLNRGQYRLGMRYGTNYLQFDGVSIDTRAITAGASFSLARQTSKLNFGIEIGDRGTETNNLIREQFTNFYIGISLSPIEKWFRKRKYD